jgi:P27 family predicted phage terminase small subunit
MQEAPTTLDKDGRELWQHITRGYEFDHLGLVILARACECYSRLRQAARVLRREGLTVKDRFNFPRLHPAWRIEAEARGLLLKHLNALHVDLGDIPNIGGNK